MEEVFVLVEKKKSVVRKLMCVLGVLATLIFSYLFLTVHLNGFIAFMIGLVTYFLITNYFEYEYSYWDDVIRITKIINKSRRRELKQFPMDDVVMIAATHSSDVLAYEKNTNLVKKDYSSGSKNASLYTIVVKGKKGLEVIYFEPDDKFINALSSKNIQKVKK